MLPKIPPVLGKSSFLAEGVVRLELHNRAISPLFVDLGSYSVVNVPLHAVLHNILVAGSAPNTKGGCQNCPLPCRAFLARQNSVPLPFFVPLRLRCVRVMSPCPSTIIATPNEGAQQ